MSSEVSWRIPEAAQKRTAQLTKKLTQNCPIVTVVAADRIESSSVFLAQISPDRREGAAGVLCHGDYSTARQD